MQEAPEDLKHLLEDVESIPWRRRAYERKGVLRKVLEQCDNKEHLRFYDKQSDLLETMQRGRQPSFVATMAPDLVNNLGGGEANKSQVAVGKRPSVLQRPREFDEKGFRFAKMFSLRLRVAITVTFACFASVIGVRVNLDAFGPPDSCNPFDDKYNSCKCGKVLERCTANWQQCVKICNTSYTTEAF